MYTIYIYIYIRVFIYLYHWYMECIIFIQYISSGIYLSLSLSVYFEILQSREELLYVTVSSPLPLPVWAMLVQLFVPNNFSERSQNKQDVASQYWTPTSELNWHGLLWLWPSCAQAAVVSRAAEYDRHLIKSHCTQSNEDEVHLPQIATALNNLLP